MALSSALEKCACLEGITGKGIHSKQIILIITLFQTMKNEHFQRSGQNANRPSTFFSLGTAPPRTAVFLSKLSLVNLLHSDGTDLIP